MRELIHRHRRTDWITWDDTWTDGPDPDAEPVRDSPVVRLDDRESGDGRQER
ncbi:hypothetical protein V5P93_002403 [Actinokineospora auranticolor]|uniref:Uncharacterized protein n=1 Tax=Actinokineospora auranticolor TaxID=155976 RepID=A0A2S6GCA0_9PSEU|nr:hypothetical protein [Actinokineospora auranticolor]PPK61861.1 hypothetical protein CLV40_1389 [Actinokineospora auranticolor]